MEFVVYWHVDTNGGSSRMLYPQSRKDTGGRVRGVYLVLANVVAASGGSSMWATVGKMEAIAEKIEKDI